MQIDMEIKEKEKEKETEMVGDGDNEDRGPYNGYGDYRDRDGGKGIGKER